MTAEDYVAYHGWVWLKNAINSHQYGLRIQLKLCEDDDLRVFESIKKHRKNRAGSGAYRVMTKMDGADKWYGPVDMLFITWAHSISNGVTITFEMGSLSEWNKIRDSRALAAGYEEGQLDKIEIMMVELNDEGKPINVEQRAKLEKMAAKRQWPKGGVQSKRAARLCQDHDFVRWVIQRGVEWTYTEGGRVTIKPSNEVTAADIAEWMRKEANIDSRAQLDHDPAALQRFEDRVMSPYLRWSM